MKRNAVAPQHTVFPLDRYNGHNLKNTNNRKVVNKSKVIRNIYILLKMVESKNNTAIT